jgi:hypothetical protein
MPLDWVTQTPLAVLAGLLLCLMALAALAGHALHMRMRHSETESQNSLVVSSVLGLLALLMGFTFSMAIDRYDARRIAVLDEANAIRTAYLQAQLLEAPHRQRLSELLVHYLDNRIVLANASEPQTQARLLAINDRIITDLWSAEAAAFDSIKTLDFSSSTVEAMNRLIEMDTTRKAARMARVPAEVFALLFFYYIVTAGFLGYTVRKLRGRVSIGILLFLFALALLATVDIDRPVSGGFHESQAPMEALLQQLRTQPPAVFDRWRGGHQ